MKKTARKSGESLPRRPFNQILRRKEILPALSAVLLRAHWDPCKKLAQLGYNILTFGPIPLPIFETVVRTPDDVAPERPRRRRATMAVECRPTPVATSTGWLTARSSLQYEPSRRLADGWAPGPTRRHLRIRTRLRNEPSAVRLSLQSNRSRQSKLQQGSWRCID